MVAVGEDLVLVRQVGAAGVDEVDAGQVVFAGNLLGPQVLLDGHRVVGAALHRRVVAHDDAFDAGDAPDAGDDTGGRDVGVVHAVGGELGELEERRAGIEQGPYPFARQHLAAPGVTLARGLAAAQLVLLDLRPQILDQRLHRAGVGGELIRPGIYGGTQDGHRFTESLAVRSI